MRRVVSFAWLIAGCGLSVAGVAVDESAGAPAPDAGLTSPVEDASSGAEDASTPDAKSDVVEIDADTCDPSKCAGLRCVAGACDYYVDCHALDVARSPASGVYQFRLDGASKVFAAYCEMNLAGGGWTLVGQSAATPNTGTFGWGSTLGDVNVETQAYSLNALGRGLVIHEFLVASGTRANLRTAYVLKAPDGFPLGQADAGSSIPTVTKVMNPDCPRSGDEEDGTGPRMFRFAGWTMNEDSFFFRDGNQIANFGLQRNRWQLNYDTCVHAGFLNGQQGLVFVR